MTNMDEYLEHFGVKGMRWGVHRQARIDKKADKLQYKADRLQAKVNRLDAKSERITYHREQLVKLAPKINMGLKVAGVAAAAGLVYSKTILKKAGSAPIKNPANWVKASGKNWKVEGEPHAVNAIVKAKRELEGK